MYMYTYKHNTYMQILESGYNLLIVVYSNYLACIDLLVVLPVLKNFYVTGQFMVVNSSAHQANGFIS